MKKIPILVLALALSFSLMTAVPVAAQEPISITGDVNATLTRTDTLDEVTFNIEILSEGPHYGVGMAFATSTDQPAFQVWYREYEEPYQWCYQEYTGTGWNGWGGDVIPLVDKTEFSATGDHTGQTFSISVPTAELGGAGAAYYYAVQVRTNLIGSYPEGWSWDSPVSEYAECITLAPPTKADTLKDNGIPGKGLDTAPGLQKPFNPNSQAGEHAGKK